jgi:hypothetical protein
MTEPAAIKTIGKWRRPGFLLEPLGWVQDRLTKAIEGEPTLVELLFELDQVRMHLTALALAHMTGEITPDLALMLLQGSRKTILNLSIGHRPVGIDRVLSHLPPKVLTAESYRKLTDLLLVPATAKFLHHRTSITEQIITGLHTLPAALRFVAIMSMFSPFCRMLLFVDGLRFLASRTGLPFESLANQIGALDQPDQVAAKITQLVDGLPLPDTLLRRYILVIVDDHPPANAYVVDADLGKWYYIAGDDEISQKNFNLISLFLTMMATPSALPPLSPVINVGGN